LSTACLRSDGVKMPITCLR